MWIPYEKQQPKLRNRSIDKKDNVSSARYKDILLEIVHKENNDHESIKHSAILLMTNQLSEQKTAISTQ